MAVVVTTFVETAHYGATKVATTEFAKLQLDQVQSGLGLRKLQRHTSCTILLSVERLFRADELP